MASIRQHRGRLLIDYRDSGSRERVYTKLSDTPANRAQLQRVADRVDAAIDSGGDIKSVLEKAGLLQPAAADQLDEPPRPAVVALRTVTEPSATPTFETFANLWFTEFKVGWRKTYVTTVRGILDQHLLPRFGATAIGSVTRAQILEFRSDLSRLRGRRVDTKLSPARINTVMLILRQILQEAADRYEFTMPMGRLRPLKIPRSDVAPFTLDQSRQIISAVRRDYANYMRTRFYTGMRSGEMHGLKWKYVDFEHRLILVRETTVGGEEDYTKTDASQRDIQMSQIVYDALKSQFEATGTMVPDSWQRWAKFPA